MNKPQRIIYLLLLSVGIFLTLIFGIWWFNPVHISHNFPGIFHAFDFILYIILTYIVWHEIIMQGFAWYIASFIKKPIETPIPKKNLRVAYLTAFVPGSEPYSMLEKTLAAMVAVDYPHDTWILDEGNDPTAQEICKRYGVRHFSRKGHEHYNMPSGKFMRKTKGGNYNSWLHQYENNYDIIAQHDVDFIPRKNFLTQTLGYFNDPHVAFVGTPQVYGNTEESWISRGAAEQTYGFYGPMQRGLHGQDMTLLIGANHLMRVEAYKDIDGYIAHIAEDLLTGMKLYSHHWKSVYVPEILLVGEGPSTWAAYFSQQMRWAFGCMDILFRHSPKLLRKMSLGRIFNYCVLLQFYFSGIAQFVGVILLSLYFIFGITSASMNLLPILILYVPLVLYQQIFSIWLQRFNADPFKEKGLMLYGKILTLATWPIFALAFLGAIQGKHLTYVVTPKGETQDNSYLPALFKLHLLLGSITLLDICIGYFTHHFSLVMIFWAGLNSIFMLYFFFAETMPIITPHVKKQMLKEINIPDFILPSMLRQKIFPNRKSEYIQTTDTE